MVIAGCFSDRGNSIHDCEVAIETSAFVRGCTISGCIVRCDGGAIRHTCRSNGTINLSPEYIDAGGVDALENVVVEVVETISHLEVVRTPLAHRLRNIRIKCLPRKDIEKVGEVGRYIGEARGMSKRCTRAAGGRN